jgi:hypothetical protein
MPPANIRLPLDPFPELVLGVYCPQAPDPQDRAGLLVNLAPWLAAHCPARLRSSLADFASRSLSFQVEARAGLPEPCPHSVANLGAEDRRRFGAATHLLLVMAEDSLLPPRTGLWSVLAAARSIAEALGGVVFDPGHTHLLTGRDLASILPGGRIAVGHHVLIAQAAGQHGLGWTSTEGMDRFGLTNLELRDHPPDLCLDAGLLVQGVAQLLVERAAAAARAAQREHDAGDPGYLDLAPLLRVAREDVARSGTTTPAGRIGGSGAAQVRVAYPGGRDGPGRFAEVLPEGRGDRTVALVAALRELFGGRPTEIISIPVGDRVVAEARAAARASLPAALRRFRGGLLPGEVLAVKRGFPYGRHGLREFMWVTVTRTHDGRIAGRLADEPAHRLDLQVGQEVVMAVDEVDDWMLVRADGTVEGDYTSRAIG